MAEAASTEVVRRPGKLIGMPSIVSGGEHGEKTVIEEGGGGRVIEFRDGGASDVEEDLLLASGSLDGKPVGGGHGGGEKMGERGN